MAIGMSNISAFTWAYGTVPILVHGNTFLFLLTISVNTATMAITIHAIVATCNIHLNCFSIPLYFLILIFEFLIFLHFILVLKKLHNLFTNILLFYQGILNFFRCIFYSDGELLLLLDQFFCSNEALWAYRISFVNELGHKVTSNFPKVIDHLIVLSRNNFLEKSTIIDVDNFRLFKLVPMISKTNILILNPIDGYRFGCVRKSQDKDKILCNSFIKKI